MKKRTQDKVSNRIFRFPLNGRKEDVRGWEELNQLTSDYIMNIGVNRLLNIEYGEKEGFGFINVWHLDESDTDANSQGRLLPFNNAF